MTVGIFKQRKKICLVRRIMSFLGVVGLLLCSLMHCVIMSMYSYTAVKSIKARFILKQTSKQTNIKNPYQPEGHGNY